MPTICFRGLDNLIATARSNKVSVLLGFQDFSQLTRDYGDKESRVIQNMVGKVFSGQAGNPKSFSLYALLMPGNNNPDDLRCLRGAREIIGIGRKKVCGLFQHAQFFAYLDEGSDTSVKVFFLVSGRNLYADACLAFGNNGVVEAGDVDAFFLHAGGVNL